ncbi:uncharacterized protein LOC110605587 [Manihot esculenta]|uniref:procollagen-proline 3-dioxygenase n=1 Tax=Manihot esculenta TaxID=3983 RepID=A0A2C9U6A9_MANES|nr:uncharacterized protein LOC110605587 [Manihot esculenta]XP_043808574.1 uncharacterized protein LOC110605587 [Manihot esculenta]XP_043808575.1 uncharacterized protein LOC110605587 [Manihot esculenta]XP_043808576.1 uncharacterized protein LOC110605587 [Manihot esculenta]XP_043808577.1 uncharacterized protein LOC110605587 [Manihot esculenta]XP_043808578.1 uncharacterized protein LOC110605587 [Manihot esculenta]XP_043808579.1 uncharacterized protein LOC110605587 [Manihot esculenta]XP_04380858
MDDAKHPRLILHEFLSLDECKELQFIHKSSSTVGYRPNVFSTTLSHLIATNCPHFIIPFLPIRERLKEKVEEFFGCEYELFVEFTGLISWTKGASIGWHSDDNRPYLKQRDFTAVCYLNTYAKDFKGGLFHFQDGEPATLVPKAGDVAIYTADSSNVHSVDEITEGERLTLTLWFSRDSDHDEDAKLISILSENLLCSSNNVPGLKLPMLAASNMYWFSPHQAPNQQSGFDICCARIHLLGFDIYSSQEKSSFSDLMILMEPVKLAKRNELFEHEFANILHLLQMVQFYCWKASELVVSHLESCKVIQLSQSQREKINALKSFVLRDHQLVEMVFSFVDSKQKCQHSFDWAKFSAAITAWEDYSHKLHKKLLLSLPYWRTEGIICGIPFEGS